MEKLLLLIEPNKVQAKVFESWLKGIGYSVAMAYTLEDALSKLKIHPSLYYMSILDADFPGGITEGIEVCRRLKSDETSKTVPLILLTYKGRLDEIIAGLDAGADMFLLKPFETDHFLERIRLIIENIDSRKYMKGVIDLALIKFLLSLKEDGDTKRFLSVLFKGFNGAIWSKIMPIMGIMPLRVALESAKKPLKREYGFIGHILANEDGIMIDYSLPVVEEASTEVIAKGFTHFIYSFLEIITTLTGNIVVDTAALC